MAAADRPTRDDDVAAIRRLVQSLAIERVVHVNLSTDKEFIYFDRHPETGAWRLSVTSKTVSAAGTAPGAFEQQLQALLFAVAEAVRDEYAPRTTVVVPDRSDEPPLGSAKWLDAVVRRVLAERMSR